MEWTGLPRAFVPTNELRASRDVLVPTKKQAIASPFPFGLSVYTKPHEDSSDPAVPLPLFFVSEKVAKDRSPSVSMYNGPGVTPGWYVVASPGTRFSVRVTKVNRREVTKPKENGFNTSFEIDRAHSNVWFGWFSKDSGVEHTSNGFTEKYTTDCFGNMSIIVRPFCFEKMVCVTEGERETSDLERSDSGMGCIRLLVQVGNRVRMRSYRDEASFEVEGQKNADEKAAAKLGMSLKVARKMECVQEKATISSYGLSGARTLKEASVSVFIREASWMRSRRLINDEGQACTYQNYRDLVKSDNAPKSSRGMGADRRNENERPKKKPRRIRPKEEAEDAAKSEPSLDEVEVVCHQTAGSYP